MRDYSREIAIMLNDEVPSISSSTNHRLITEDANENPISYLNRVTSLECTDIYASDLTQTETIADSIFYVCINERQS